MTKAFANRTIQIIFFATFLCFSFSTTSCKPGGPEKFADKAGHFKIAFPKKPVIEVDKSGILTIHAFNLVNPAGDNFTYNLYYMDYPESFTDTLETEEIYTLFADALSGTVNPELAELLAMTNEKMLGYVGRDFKWLDKQTGMIARIRLFLVGSRLYIIALSYPSKADFDLKINQFMESFELTDIKPNPKEMFASSGKIAAKYDISFPGPTVSKEQETVTDYGIMKIVVEGYESRMKNDDNMAYMVIRTEYQDGSPLSDSLSLDQYYDRLVQGFLASRQSVLISQKKITSGDLQGIEVKESFSNRKMIITSRVFLVGSYDICAAVMTIPANDENAAMHAFLDSFKVRE